MSRARFIVRIALVSGLAFAVGRASAGVDVTVDATTLTDLLAAMVPASVALDLPAECVGLGGLGAQLGTGRVRCGLSGCQLAPELVGQRGNLQPDQTERPHFKRPVQLLEGERPISECSVSNSNTGQVPRVLPRPRRPAGDRNHIEFADGAG